MPLSLVSVSLVSAVVFLGISVLFLNNSAVVFALGTFLFILHYIKWKSSAEKEINTRNKAVIVTGCDSGFGNRLAKKLHDKGYHVFAGCLFPEGSGAKGLKEICSDRLKVLSLDVTSDESVANALKFVKDNLSSNVFWAVVNNAGVSKGSAVDFSTLEHIKQTLDVNTLGVVRMAQAFLPLLKESKGRIVNVNSTLGRSAMTFTCAYSMSKHASLAFTESLHLEMNDWGVKVISIEPETFRTNITDAGNVINRIKDEVKQIDESIIASYGERYFEKLEDVIKQVAQFSSSNLDIVVDDMVAAVTKKHPRLVYKPRWSLHSRMFYAFLENIPFSLYVIVFKITTKLLKYPTPKDAIK